MRNIFSLLCVVSVFGLIGCSKSNQAASQQAASACSGDPYLMKYNCSIDRVQASAENGDADAEYALGYMYYYGVNTARDQDSAMLWISRSAAQGQPLAKSALAMLQGKNAVKVQASVQAQPAPAQRVTSKATPAPLAASGPATTPAVAKVSNQLATASAQPATQVNASREMAEDTLKTVAHDAAEPSTTAQSSQAIEPTAQPVTAAHAVETPNTAVGAGVLHSAQAAHAVETDDVAQMEGRLLHVSNDGFTLQLMGNHDEGVVKNFVTSHHLGKQAAYYYSSFDNSKWYMLVYGQYKTVRQAHEAIAKLPPELRQLQPWIKPNKDIKAEIESRHLTS